MRRNVMVIAIMALLIASASYGADEAQAPQEQPAPEAQAVQQAPKEQPEDMYVAQGVELGKKGMYDEALKVLDEALSINPNSFTAYHYRATVWAYKGDLDKAIADWDASIAIDDKQYLSHYSRGLALYRKGEIEKAIADWDRSIELNPHYMDTYFQRASAKYNKKDYDGAIADFETLLEADTANAGKYHYSMAVIYSVKKDYDKSWEHMHEIEKLGQTQAPEYQQFLKILKKESGRDY